MEYICNVCKRHYASYQSLWDTQQKISYMCDNQ